MGGHNVVVFTGTSMADLVRWDDFCHARSIAFIAADVRSVTPTPNSSLQPQTSDRVPNPRHF